MDRIQLKEQLLTLKEDVEEFTLTLTGKSNKKVNGLYHPDDKEIIIYDGNFEDENSLIYTAIHEFSHHIQFTTSPIPITSRSHTTDFWNLFHNLLIKAEEKGIYVNVFEKNEEFVELTNEIRDNYMKKNGELMKEFGRLLIKAAHLCERFDIRFEDYVDRCLRLNRSSAKSIMKLFSLDINPEIGYENMKIVSNIPNEERRKEVEKAFEEGDSPDMVKAQIAEKTKKKKKGIELLESERRRIERTIERMSVRLEKINQSIEDYVDEDAGE